MLLDESYLLVRISRPIVQMKGTRWTHFLPPQIKTGLVFWNDGSSLAETGSAQNEITGGSRV
jgi:hypothetical protein